VTNDSIIDGLNKAYEMMQGRVPRRYHLALHDAIHEIVRLRTENALLVSYLYPVGMMLNPDAMTLRPTTLFDDGVDGVTAEEVEEFLEADRD